MFVLLRDVTAAKQAIATLLATALVLWASGAFNTAQAANITEVYLLLGDSAPGAQSTQELEFVSPTGVANGEDIVITYPGTFDLTGIGAEDIDILINGTNKVAAEWSLVNGGTTLTLTIDTGTIAAGATTTILIGSNATNEGAPDTDITNPASPANGNESYEIDISAGASDSGHTRVVILDTVLVTAQVNTVFDFTVSGVATGTSVGVATTSDASGSTTLDYGQLVANVPETLGQRLNVDTNAANGFVVTVFKDGAFDSSTGADIDDFRDGVFSDTPEAWAVPGNTLGNEEEYGHWGVTSLDTDSNGARTTEFAAGEYVSIGTSSSPTVLMASAGPTIQTATDATFTGSTTVGYRVEITPLQEAGDDYQAVLTYIATPTF